MWKAVIGVGAATTLAASAATAAQAQTTSTGPQPTPSVTSLDEVVVTGTRQTNRTVAESMSPIQVLNPQALEQSGKLGVQEILANVLPSFDLPSNSGSNLSNVVRIAEFRGLNPDQVLILINGKRRHPSAIVNVSGTVGVGAQAVDLNTIPPGAIARIEVLSDGAAAQYGSDAIGGVINIILKDSDHAGALNVQGGKYQGGDGANVEGDLNGGFKLGDNGFINISASAIDQRGTSRAANATMTPLFYPGNPLNNQPDGVLYHNYGVAPYFIVPTSYNLEKPLGDGITLYSFGTYTHLFAQQYLGYRAPSNANNVLAIYPNGFQPNNAVAEDDSAITIGLRKADVLGWTVDVSATDGVNYTVASLRNSVNPTYGTASPIDFHLGNLIAAQFTTNLDLHREFNVGLAAPLSVAAGAEFKQDSYAIEAGDVAGYADGGQPILTGPSAGKFTDVPGAQAESSFSPFNASYNHRESVAGYGDVETQLLHGWDVGLAGRYESYSDFGDNLTGKLSSRYQITPAIAVRGTVNNAFRAPSIGQEYYSTSSTTQYQGVDYKIALIPANSAAAKILGASPLKAEESFNLSGGLVFTPIHNLTVTLDAYHIHIDHRIVLSSNIGLLPSGALNPTVASLLKAQGIQGVNVGSYFLNGANTKTEGVDLVVNYKLNVLGGKLSLNGAFDENDSEIVSLSQNASQPIFGTTVFNSTSQKQLTKTTPANKIILSGDYTIGKFNVFLRENRFGHYLQPSTVAGADSYAKPAWTTDVEILYSLTSHVQVGIGAQNLFNVYPTRANPLNFVASTFNGANIYNANSPFGISGGDYYGRLIFKW
jgi:iron complex outermembrane receptor protein